MGPNLDDPNFGDEYRRRESAPLRAKRRRSSFWGFSIGTLGGLWIVVDSIQAFRLDGWGALVTAVPRNNHESLPWFFFTGIGLIVMAACLWSLYVMLRDPQE